MKRTFFGLFIGSLLLSLTLTSNAEAQWNAETKWSAGISYELRNEEPTNGFGIRLEKSVLPYFTMIDVGVRAHFSYFHERNSFTRDGITIERNFETFDLGVAGTGGVAVGLVKPYIGLGLGIDNSNLEFSNNINEIQSEDRNPYDKADFYWNAFIGAAISITPKVNPFIEYRFSQISGRDDINLTNVSRLALGISLRF